MYFRHINLLNGFAIPMIENMPYTRSCLTNGTGHTAHGHLTLYEKHGIGFEKQCKPTIFTCPWNIYHDCFVINGFDTRNAGMKKTMMFEEIQMTPDLIYCIIGSVLVLANSKTVPTIEAQPNMEIFVGVFTIFKLNLGYIPWF
jgi:hypothetical protein